jgi:hypothetical protein
MKLSAKTTSNRVTVSTTAVELVPPESTHRRVTLIAPGSPQMFFAIDHTNKEIADGWAYQWVPLGSYPVSFELQPGQFVYAIGDTNGVNPIGVICEYLED